VIQIESAQEILVGLSTACVLGDNDTRNGFKDFAASQNGAVGQLLCASRALTRGLRDTKHAVPPARNNDFLQRWYLVVCA
jgi:hypothetical protein